MDLWFLIMEVGMLLGLSFLMGAIAQRLGQSTIIGYLTAGAILGPVLFNADTISQTAELGVALLLFSIGLEFSFSRLRQLGLAALGSGTVQVLLTLTLVTLIGRIRLPWPEAIAIGAITALSSTAVVGCLTSILKAALWPKRWISTFIQGMHPQRRS